MKIETYRDLQNFLSGLTESQLEQPVKCWGEYREGSISGADVLEEDYISPTSEGLEPRSAYADESEYDEEPTVHEKGTVLLNLQD